VTDRARGLPGGEVRVVVTGKNGTYPAVAGDEPLRSIVVLGHQTDAIAGMCGESDYGPNDCAFNRPGNLLKCLR